MTHSRHVWFSGGTILNFTQLLAGASTVDAVTALANRFLADIPAEMLERFPAHCRPARIDNAAAIHHWRRLLLAEVSTLPGTPDLRLQELAVFFLRASSRAHALASSREAANATATIEKTAA